VDGEEEDGGGDNSLAEDLASASSHRGQSGPAIQPAESVIVEVDAEEEESTLEEVEADARRLKQHQRIDEAEAYKATGRDNSTPAMLTAGSFKRASSHAGTTSESIQITRDGSTFSIPTDTTLRIRQTEDGETWVIGSDSSRRRYHRKPAPGDRRTKDGEHTAREHPRQLARREQAEAEATRRRQEDFEAAGQRQLDLEAKRARDRRPLPVPLRRMSDTAFPSRDSHHVVDVPSLRIRETMPRPPKPSSTNLLPLSATP